MGYLYRRDDNGEVVEVGFEQMIEQDFSGYITLEDGVDAKRVHVQQSRSEPKSEKIKETAKDVSDSLGFTELQLNDFENHRKQAGCRGVEFKRDPTEPTFFQVHFDSPQAKAKYIKSRGMSDNNSRNGGQTPMPPEQFEKAKEMFLRKYEENRV